MFGLRLFAFACTVLGLAALLPPNPASAFPQPFAKETYKAAKVSKGKHAVGPRPARWCGWYMRTQKGGGPELNLARNWKNWGRPSKPKVGAVVIWPHHVGMITGKTADGHWIVRSGNDNGRVRERPRSVKGAVFRVG